MTIFLVVTGLILSLLFGFIASLPAIIFKKVKKVNLNWQQKVCFCFLAFIIYNVLCMWAVGEAANKPNYHAPIFGYIMFTLFLADFEKTPSDD